jgi:hypothetical protein
MSLLAGYSPISRGPGAVSRVGALGAPLPPSFPPRLPEVLRPCVKTADAAAAVDSTMSFIDNFISAVAAAVDARAAASAPPLEQGGKGEGGRKAAPLAPLTPSDPMSLSLSEGSESLGSFPGDPAAAGGTPKPPLGPAAHLSASSLSSPNSTYSVGCDMEDSYGSVGSLSEAARGAPSTSWRFAPSGGGSGGAPLSPPAPAAPSPGGRAALLAAAEAHRIPLGVAVFDVDDTLVRANNGAPMEAFVSLVNRLKLLRVSVHLVTGRLDDLRGEMHNSTVHQLALLGMRQGNNWDTLTLAPAVARTSMALLSQWKRAQRARIVGEVQARARAAVAAAVAGGGGASEAPPPASLGSPAPGARPRAGWAAALTGGRGGAPLTPAAARSGGDPSAMVTSPASGGGGRSPAARSPASTPPHGARLPVHLLPQPVLLLSVGDQWGDLLPLGADSDIAALDVALSSAALAASSFGALGVGGGGGAGGFPGGGAPSPGGAGVARALFSAAPRAALPGSANAALVPVPSYGALAPPAGGGAGGGAPATLLVPPVSHGPRRFAVVELRDVASVVAGAVASAAEWAVSAEGGGGASGGGRSGGGAGPLGGSPAAGGSLRLRSGGATAAVPAAAPSYLGAGYGAPLSCVPGAAVACYLLAQPPSPGAPAPPAAALPVAPAALYHARALGAPSVALSPTFGGEQVDVELGRPLWGLKLPVADLY